MDTPWGNLDTLPVLLLSAEVHACLLSLCIDLVVILRHHACQVAGARSRLPAPPRSAQDRLPGSAAAHRDAGRRHDRGVLRLQGYLGMSNKWNTLTPQQQQGAKYMIVGAPFVMTLIFWNFPAALCYYWACSNVYTIALELSLRHPGRAPPHPPTMPLPPPVCFARRTPTHPTPA